MTNQTEKEQFEQEEATEAQQQTEEQVEEVVEETEVELVDPLVEAQNRIAELEVYVAKVDEREQDIRLRAKAEVENFRRRSEQEAEKSRKFALEKFAKDLLNVADNLERALATLENADESVKGLAQGVELTQKELSSTLSKHNVVAFGEVGEAFNPELHQAVSHQPAEGIESNHISAVLQKGYKLNDRVIRDAMVMVAP